jgi:hypothetical protein
VSLRLAWTEAPDHLSYGRATVAQASKENFMTTVNNNRESLGPAQRIIDSAIAHVDHMYHGRPGIVSADRSSPVGVVWKPVKHKLEQGVKVVYGIEKLPGAKKVKKTRLGVLRDDNKIYSTPSAPESPLGRFHRSGLFAEVITHIYRQILAVWKLDNEFAARWASYVFDQDHQDMKVIMAAFMIVQSRKGDPIRGDDGTAICEDEDYRQIGEAIMLLRRDKKDLNPKQLLRIRDVLLLPEIVAINRDEGFGGTSMREPPLGRWNKVITKWLEYREKNPRVLDGLVKAGFSGYVKQLARLVGYKPAHPSFFEKLRWEQDQSKLGHRTIKVGEKVAAAETWDDLSEEQICERIVKTKPGWKRIVGFLPKRGVTQAVVAAAIEAGSFSDKDLIIATPTFEDLGLLKIPAIRARWEAATKNATDMRAANVARNVRSKDVKEKLQEAADKAVAKAVEAEMRGLDIYLFVDISGSMSSAIEHGKRILNKLVPAFSVEQLHVRVFTETARDVEIKPAKGTKNATKETVDLAFRGINAGGGTNYGGCFRKAPTPNKDHDVVCIFVGDEEEQGHFEHEVRASGLNPVAFGLVRLGNKRPTIVQDTAARLKIPCFMIDPATFDDVYAVPRVMRNMISATPVGVAPASSTKIVRETIIDKILATPLLTKPTWA